MNRVRAAWAILRGRPVMYRMTLGATTTNRGLIVRIDSPGALICGNTFLRPE